MNRFEAGMTLGINETKWVAGFKISTEGKDPTPVARAYASYLHLDNLGTAPEVISTLFKQMPNIFNLERKLKSSDS